MEINKKNYAQEFSCHKTKERNIDKNGKRLKNQFYQKYQIRIFSLAAQKQRISILSLKIETII